VSRGPFSFGLDIFPPPSVWAVRLLSVVHAPDFQSRKNPVLRPFSSLASLPSTRLLFLATPKTLFRVNQGGFSTSNFSPPPERNTPSPPPLTNEVSALLNFPTASFLALYHQTKPNSLFTADGKNFFLSIRLVLLPPPLVLRSAVFPPLRM